MSTPLTLSLLLNVLVLVPVCAGIAGDASWAQACYGPDAPARRILWSVYLAIGVASFALLFVREPAAIGSLLAVQILYKLSTPFTVGTPQNPVVLSNLAIAAFHAAALAVTWRAGGFDGR